MNTSSTKGRRWNAARGLETAAAVTTSRKPEDGRERHRETTRNSRIRSRVDHRTLNKIARRVFGSWEEKTCERGGYHRDGDEMSQFEKVRFVIGRGGRGILGISSDQKKREVGKQLERRNWKEPRSSLIGIWCWGNAVAGEGRDQSLWSESKALLGRIQPD